MDSKPLEFIQAIITRLGGNSFQMKAWNVALMTAVIGFVATKDGRPAAAAYALAPSVAFWLLDAYYVALESRFRDLYNEKTSSSEPSYDLKITPVDFMLMIYAIFRPAVSLVHIPVFGVILWVTR
jgi:hypothetical protein